MSISAGLSGSRWAVCSKICEKWCLGYGACEGQGPVTAIAVPPCDDVRLRRTKADVPHHAVRGRGCQGGEAAADVSVLLLPYRAFTAMVKIIAVSSGTS